MSLFEKRRPVTALSDQEIQSIKQELHSILQIAQSFDQVMGKSGNAVVGLEGRVRADLLAFVLYLDCAGRAPTDPAEIAVVNTIFDTDLTKADFALYRKEVSNKLFEKSVPPSILIYSEMGKAVQREQFRTSDGTVGPEGTSNTLSSMFVHGLINLYALIGSAFISADGEAREKESGDLIRYLSMMNRAINGADAPLPKGPAQQAYDAHIRLFGKKPKLG